MDGAVVALDGFVQALPGLEQDTPGTIKANIIEVIRQRRGHKGRNTNFRLTIGNISQ
jgi:hypothetical protein